MKLKRLLSVMGLGLFAAISAGAGALLAKDAKAEPVKADDPKTWMSLATVDMGAIIAGNDGEVSNIRWHVWGNNIDEIYYMHESGCDNNYTVMASFTDSQSLSGCQFIFTQTGGTYPGEKYSADIELGFFSSTENTDFRVTSVDSWTDGKWGVSAKNVYKAFSWFGGTSKSYVRDPEKLVLSVKDIEVNNANFYVESRIIHGTISDYTQGLTRSGSYKYLKSYSPHFLELLPGSTYDFFVYNEYDDNGIFEIKEHSAKNESYIYYVLEDNTPTEHYIYSWGGSEQFGSWPGTKITAVEDVEEVTRNGVLHFEGSETPKLIYRIPIATGYPYGDDHFKFNDNASWQSENREIVLESAYWYTGPANADAGDAIDLLIIAETYRNGAEDYSVCNIAPENAKYIVDLYNAETDKVRDYVDRSSVYTYKGKDKTQGSELVSYRKVIERLGIIGGVTPVGGSPRNPFVTDNTIEANSAALIAAVSIIAIASISTVAVLVVIKKRKHE